MWRARLLGLLLFWPALAAAQVQPPAVGASAQVHDASGRLLATATFREAPDQTLISLAFPDRAALTGNHGIQIHELGRCEPPEFASAGGIFNPFGKQHGLLTPDGPMAGDIPNLVISSAGLAGYNTSAPLVRLAPGPASLLRQGGTALVIYAQPDDGRTPPEGNAGARIACGVIVAGAAESGTDTSGSLLIGVLGVLLIGAGVFLRRKQSR
jgi:Cu-Zn family superoxide dismutase